MSDINREARKSPEQLEREINESRAHLTETLSQLEQRLSPGQIFDQVLSYGRANGGEFSRNLVDTVKTNPVPTMLTVLGIGWMMIGQNRPRPQYMGARYGGPVESSTELGYVNDYDEPTNASYGVDPAYDPAYGEGLGDTSYTGAGTLNSDGYWDGRGADADQEPGAGERLSGKAGELKDQAGQRWQDAKQRLSGQKRNAQYRMHAARQHAGDSLHRNADAMRHRAEMARRGLSHQAHRASEGFDYMLREQPLAVGALGLAVGALIGALLPPTRQEDELLGERRDRLAAEAMDATRKTYETAKETGARVAEQAKRDVKHDDGTVSKPH